MDTSESLTKIFDQNAQQYVALREGFVMDRIGDARNLNKNHIHAKAGWKPNDFHDPGQCPENPLVFSFSKTVIL